MDNPIQKAWRLKKQTVEKSGVFKRRKEGIKKKAMELSVLCDVAVCVIIQAPNGELEIWPENRDQVGGALKEWKGKLQHVETTIQESHFCFGKQSTIEKEIGSENNQVFLGCNDDFVNGLSANSTLLAVQSCSKGKEIADNPGVLFDLKPTCAYNDPVEFNEFYDLPPLQVFHSSLGSEWTESQGDIAINSGIDFSLFVDDRNTTSKGFAPLQAFHPSPGFGWVESQGDIAGTSGIDFSVYGDDRNAACEGFTPSAYSADLSFMDDSTWKFYFPELDHSGF